MKVFCVIIFGMLFAVGLNLVLNELCTTPTSRLGRCIQPQNCQSILRIQQIRPDLRTSVDASILQRSNCGSLGTNGDPSFCCPILENESSCGASEVGNRIFGGTETTIGEHPWAALLMYRVGASRFQTQCGGTLISRRYVLTAAHCIENVPRNWKLEYVRLCEWDLADPNECVQIGNDTVCRQNYEIEETTVHSHFDRSSNALPNDIALLKLKNVVQFGKYIKPICLPLDNALRNMPINQHQFTVVGWGQTEIAPRSSVQIQVVVTGKNNRVCNDMLRNRGVLLTDSQLCVGGEEGKDSCRGDSGGPLMRQVEVKWYLTGLVSFGERQCGSRNHPSVYTNVEKYLDWIENVIS
ncbi:CLIP domain-containing serine protease B15-like [Toxorhynchites rutilus septentrionalis]|uniref:CLIP domain-containing serine protease B15-like n=1 Tax=Toxorhynchites rutilus septentrionalis TaxID=329112 RepID=UPI0024797608|nr:CLIP domain-containing serine protease B15-like [Toxorhynchites rutilus septentrionalis]